MSRIPPKPILLRNRLATSESRRSALALPAMFSALDHEMMARALALAAKARCWARPNPHVGCVLLKEGVVVGEGYTQPAGADHAEVVALQAAGAAAKDATAYVTLEPCAHQGKTPPCSQALVSAGVTRVVVAVTDPNPKVDGQGLAQLREAGVTVQHGLLASSVEEQLAGFLARQRRGRGRLRAKLAMSLDGRTAMASGESQWITGPEARRDVQNLRAESCAIVTGVGTVLADDCALTIREVPFGEAHLAPESRRALRVVADSQLHTPADAAVLAGDQPSLLVHASDALVPEALATAPLHAIGLHDGTLNLEELLAELARRECNEILLESGPRLAGSMLSAGVLDELIVFIAPKLMGSSARPLFDLPLEKMIDARRLELLEQNRVGQDLRLRLAVVA
ncbi:MAG: bifunctional diaminohydroxyphosphoribosylaminopyrimidine deaminase/5-amino-6-(5-phosphoribosylamino)uracil reductase RibD [Pseudomonadota bacterium]